jgi:hypothetical protein
MSDFYCLGLGFKGWVFRFDLFCLGLESRFWSLGLKFSSLKSRV